MVGTDEECELGGEFASDTLPDGREDSKEAGGGQLPQLGISFNEGKFEGSGYIK